jgi:hypothetical protein
MKPAGDRTTRKETRGSSAVATEKTLQVYNLISIICPFVTKLRLNLSQLKAPENSLPYLLIYSTRT